MFHGVQALFFTLAFISLSQLLMVHFKANELIKRVMAITDYYVILRWITWPHREGSFKNWFALGVWSTACLTFNQDIKMLFRHYFCLILSRFAQKRNLINTCNRSPLGPLRRLAMNLGAPTFLILSICKPFSFLTTRFLLTGTVIALKIPFTLEMKG